jgi:hypothetical protein
MKGSSTGFVQQALQLAVIKAGSKKNLASAIGTRSQTVTSWERGAWPSEKNFLALQAYVGSADDVTRKEVTQAQQN